MKLEAGKTYRTQDGHKAQCISDDVKKADGLCAICLLEMEKQEIVLIYQLSGHTYNIHEKGLAIVGEWEEPVVGYMAVRKHYPNTVDGVKLAGVTSHLYQTAEQARNSVDKFSQYAIVRVEFVPGVDQLGGE